MKELLVIIAILVLFLEGYRWLRQGWLLRWLKKPVTKRLRKLAILRPKSERDCPHWHPGKVETGSNKRELPLAWCLRKSQWGPKKRTSPEGFFCSNPNCEYYRIADEQIHALVWDGHHWMYEEIRDLKCQACVKKFTVLRNTVLYQLKSYTELVEKILWLLVLGVDASALEEVFGVREQTIRSWLCRSGMHGRKLHERLIVELELIHLQLDEPWTNVKNGSQETWLWDVCDTRTKLIPIVQVGARSQVVAYEVVHELKMRLKDGCVPVFITYGLKHYFHVLTALLGKWERVKRKKKPVWVVWDVIVISGAFL